ncbi:MAG: hypothetical protein U0559_01165 [Anaerolineae bacterium]
MVSTQRFGTTIMYSLADKRLIDALDRCASSADNLVHQTGWSASQPTPSNTALIYHD